MRSAVLVMFLFAALPAAGAQVLPVANCSGGGGGGGFGESLGALFSSLVSLSSASNAANDTAGAGEDAAYGLYMCQGDLSGPGCQSCVLTAINGINQTCAGARRGVIWYDLCLLRYSDNDFFGEVDSGGINMSNPRELTSSLEPYQVMSALVEVAASRRPLMFAVNASDLYPIFATAQCTSDLTSAGCRRCLTTILAFMRTCCLGHKGWRYIAPSCWIRYEATPFFDVTGYTEIIRSRCSADDFPAPLLASDGANLETLVAQLGSNALSSGFYNTTSGDRNAGILFGLVLCREDPATLPSRACTSCLHRASTAMVGECPNKTQGIMWYDDCLLRYSNQSFFNVVEGEGQTFCSQQSVSPETDNLTVSGASALVGVAVGRASMFASDVITINNVDTSYVSVQCTRDLSRESCRSCLENGMNRIATDCHQRKGWQFLSGSCMIRYEVYPFFNLTTSPPPTAAPQLPPGGGGGSSHSQGGKRRRSSNVRIIAVALPIAGLLLLGILLFRAWNLRRKRGSKNLKLEDFDTGDVPLIDLHIIQLATSNFSNENKLGEGGFGPVYKGVLHDGKEIAVKRLSQKSKQGPTEFENEAKLIAKLQHKNLVRMLGCSVGGEEKLLIYEYLPNRSLDGFLFDPNKRVQLDWEKRFHIISGIAGGLLYLHEDSLLKVIHRDLKASNILLDEEMNPKISDFGMAKIYASDQNDVNTNRIVGTYGYMAPEYAMDGVFSVKSDVYSFGVLLLEIISGERNGREHLEQHGENLLRTAWELWKQDKTTEFIDRLLNCEVGKAVKCIHIGLLCVQENAEERPTMAQVVVMLRTEGMVLPLPGQPPNFQRRTMTLQPEASLHTSSAIPTALQSINEVTETFVFPR